MYFVRYHNTWRNIIYAKFDFIQQKFTKLKINSSSHNINPTLIIGLLIFRGFIIRFLIVHSINFKEFQVLKKWSLEMKAYPEGVQKRLKVFCHGKNENENTYRREGEID